MSNKNEASEYSERVLIRLWYREFEKSIREREYTDSEKKSYAKGLNKNKK